MDNYLPTGWVLVSRQTIVHPQIKIEHFCRTLSRNNWFWKCILDFNMSTMVPVITKYLQCHVLCDKEIKERGKTENDSSNVKKKIKQRQKSTRKMFQRFRITKKKKKNVCKKKKKKKKSSQKTLNHLTQLSIICQSRTKTLIFHS